MGQPALTRSLKVFRLSTKTLPRAFLRSTASKRLLEYWLAATPASVSTTESKYPAIASSLRKPAAGAGWQRSGMGHPSNGYWVCYVEQGHYGHASRKPTWLLANTHSKPQELNWTKGEQRLPEWMIERYGYEKARRIGVVAMVGGKDKTRIRNATPEPFRDVLLSIARSAALW